MEQSLTRQRDRLQAFECTCRCMGNGQAGQGGQGLQAGGRANVEVEECHPSGNGISGGESHHAAAPCSGPDCPAVKLITEGVTPSPGLDSTAAGMHASERVSSEGRQPAWQVDQVQAVRSKAAVPEQASGIKFLDSAGQHSGLHLLNPGDSFASAAARKLFFDFLQCPRRSTRPHPGSGSRIRSRRRSR